jgi:hypothetical protein
LKLVILKLFVQAMKAVADAKMVFLKFKAQQSVDVTDDSVARPWNES